MSVQALWRAFLAADQANRGNPTLRNLMRRVNAYLAWRAAYLEEAS